MEHIFQYILFVFDNTWKLEQPLKLTCKKINKTPNTIVLYFELDKHLSQEMMLSK